MPMSTGRISAGLIAVAFVGVGAWGMLSSDEAEVIAVSCRDVEQEQPGATIGMVQIVGGTFEMGSDAFYSDEAPVRSVDVPSFWIDRTEVTNQQFSEFVDASGYITLAERGIVGVVPPGAAVFQWPDQNDQGSWVYVAEANWRHPEGADSSIEGLADFPVVQIALEDAVAYASWKGHVLPSEAQWEFAARGGLAGATYAWGDELAPGGVWQANNWQGFFPFQDEAKDGFAGRAPVGCFEPNGYGLFDMIGNVWEWTADPYVEAEVAVGVIKGGSYLCAPNYCRRYRPAARHPQEVNLGAAHIGFRTVLLVSESPRLRSTD